MQVYNKNEQMLSVVIEYPLYYVEYFQNFLEYELLINYIFNLRSK